MKLAKLLLVVVFVFAMSAIAYAETQSVKVSGDIAERAFARNASNLQENDSVAAGAAVSNSWATFLQSTAEVQVDADMTDNVSTTVRLLNQRVWGDSNYTSTGDYGRAISPNGRIYTRTTSGTDSNAVNVDLAYVELKEFLYSPLTLKIGRQDLWFGKGFIIGANQQDPKNTLYAPEYTAMNSFDAVRATLDYNPWTIDGVYAKIAENGLRADDDVNLWGINTGYTFDSYNAEAEAYWWYKQSRNPNDTNAGISLNGSGKETNDVHTIGARGSFDPIEDWTLGLEGAYQFGQYMLGGTVATDPTQVHERDRSAFAIDASAECRYFQNNFAWKPVLGTEYILYSGEDKMGELTGAKVGKYQGWDPMFRGKFDTAIREWQNVYYTTAQGSSPAYTNEHQVLVWGSVQPIDSVKVKATYGHFWLYKRYTTAAGNRNVGDEVDINTTWDYTEDVQFGLLAGWFIPGSHFSSPQDDVATDLVGTVTVNF
ncbi:MAG: alginate export family protein [Candidatus Omnitrophica bacterium]|nr:alginate export family protein [Candidatus Omnitrophota bacterium]